MNGFNTNFIITQRRDTSGLKRSFRAPTNGNGPRHVSSCYNNNPVGKNYRHSLANQNNVSSKDFFHTQSKEIRYSVANKNSHSQTGLLNGQFKPNQYGLLSKNKVQFRPNPEIKQYQNRNVGSLTNFYTANGTMQKMIDHKINNQYLNKNFKIPNGAPRQYYSNQREVTKSSNPQKSLNPDRYSLAKSKINLYQTTGSKIPLNMNHTNFRSVNEETSKGNSIPAMKIAKTSLMKFVNLNDIPDSKYRKEYDSFKQFLNQKDSTVFKNINGVKRMKSSIVSKDPRYSNAMGIRNASRGSLADICGSIVSTTTYKTLNICELATLSKKEKQIVALGKNLVKDKLIYHKDGTVTKVQNKDSIMHNQIQQAEDSESEEIISSDSSLLDVQNGPQNHYEKSQSQTDFFITETDIKTETEIQIQSEIVNKIESNTKIETCVETETYVETEKKEVKQKNETEDSKPEVKINTIQRISNQLESLKQEALNNVSENIKESIIINEVEAKPESESQELIQLEKAASKKKINSIQEEAESVTVMNAKKHVIKDLVFACTDKNLEVNNEKLENDNNDLEEENEADEPEIQNKSEEKIQHEEIEEKARVSENMQTDKNNIDQYDAERIRSIVKQNMEIMKSLVNNKVEEEQKTIKNSVNQMEIRNSVDHKNIEDSVEINFNETESENSQQFEKKDVIDAEVVEVAQDDIEIDFSSEIEENLSMKNDMEEDEKRKKQKELKLFYEKQLELKKLHEQNQKLSNENKYSMKEKLIMEKEQAIQQKLQDLKDKEEALKNKESAILEMEKTIRRKESELRKTPVIPIQKMIVNTPESIEMSITKSKNNSEHENIFKSQELNKKDNITYKYKRNNDQFDNMKQEMIRERNTIDNHQINRINQSNPSPNVNNIKNIPIDSNLPVFEEHNWQSLLLDEVNKLKYVPNNGELDSLNKMVNSTIDYQSNSQATRKNFIDNMNQTTPIKHQYKEREQRSSDQSISKPDEVNNNFDSFNINNTGNTHIMTKTQEIIQSSSSIKNQAHNRKVLDNQVSNFVQYDRESNHTQNNKKLKKIDQKRFANHRRNDTSDSGIGSIVDNDRNKTPNMSRDSSPQIMSFRAMLKKSVHNEANDNNESTKVNTFNFNQKSITMPAKQSNFKPKNNTSIKSKEPSRIAMKEIPSANSIKRESNTSLANKIQKAKPVYNRNNKRQLEDNRMSNNCVNKFDSSKKTFGNNNRIVSSSGNSYNNKAHMMKHMVNRSQITSSSDNKINVNHLAKNINGYPNQNQIKSIELKKHTPTTLKTHNKIEKQADSTKIKKTKRRIKLTDYASC